MPELIQGVQQAHPAKRIQVFFEDESRFGQQGVMTNVWARKGTRPQMVRQCEYKNAYIIGAVCPETGQAEGLICSHLNTQMMNIFLSQLSETLGENVQALLVWDGAGYHRSSTLEVPENITLVQLPAYSPELNPIELLWLYMKSHYWANRVFPTEADLLNYAVEMWGRVCFDQELMKTLCHASYAVNYQSDQ